MIYLELFMPVEPVAKGRPRFYRHGRAVVAVTPNKTRKYEAEILNRVARHMRAMSLETQSGPLKLEIVFYFKRPKSHTKKQRLIAHHIIRPDLDNLCKGVLDALNGELFKDDSQVCMLSAVKRYCQDTQQPGVLLRVEKLDQQKKLFNPEASHG